MLTLVLQESQELTAYAFVMLPLVMISLYMLTFRLMVTMVADFCSLVILIHNTLRGEIMISSTRTTRVTSIPQYVMIYFYMQRFKFIDFMVIEVHFFKKKKKKNKKMKNMDKMWKSLFQILCVSHITLLPIFVYRLFFTCSLP